MVAKQRIRMANEKHSKNITQRGNVAKTSVRSAARRSAAADAEARARGRVESSAEPAGGGAALGARGGGCRSGAARGRRETSPGVQALGAPGPGGVLHWKR